MAVLAPQAVKITGTVPTLVAASGGGDQVQPGDLVFLVVKNGDASSKTVTVVVPGSEFGQPRPDVPVVVAAGATEYIGPLVHDLADPTTHNVGISYSAVTSVTVGVLNL